MELSFETFLDTFKAVFILERPGNEEKKNRKRRIINIYNSYIYSSCVQMKKKEDSEDESN